MRRTLLALTTLAATLAVAAITPAADEKGQSKDKDQIRLLIITGDNVKAHDWKSTTEAFKEFLPKRSNGRIKVDVTTTPRKDLTKENLAKYDVLMLNYANTPQGPEQTQWTDENKEAFLDAVRSGTGLVVAHYASAAFSNPNWVEFEKAIAGGWRYKQGFHGPPHEFTVKKTDQDHPVSRGLPASFNHVIDELYQNSLLTPGSVVLATAYSDPNKPRGTGKDEPVVWVNVYGNGRVFNNALGHDVNAMSDPEYQKWMTRGVEWAATGEVTSDGEQK